MAHLTKDGPELILMLHGGRRREADRRRGRHRELGIKPVRAQLPARGAVRVGGETDFLRELLEILKRILGFRLERDEARTTRIAAIDIAQREAVRVFIAGDRSQGQTIEIPVHRQAGAMPFIGLRIVRRRIEEHGVAIEIAVQIV